MSIYKKNGSNNELFNDCLITEGYVSWVVCSWKISPPESLYSSKGDGLLINDTSGEKRSFDLCYLYFNRDVIISDIAINQNCRSFNNTLVFLLTAFLHWLWNGLTDSKQMNLVVHLWCFSFINNTN